MIANIIIHMRDVIKESISAAKLEIAGVKPQTSARVILHVNFMSQKGVRRMERNELRIGQTVYIEPVGNAARYGTDIIETKISKIGKKYIETEKFGEMYKFNISDGKQKDTGYGYGYDYILYLSRSEVENKQEKGSLLSYFNLCDWYHLNLTLDQLRRIKVIVDEGESNETDII